jgi:hypothetical protein
VKFTFKFEGEIRDIAALKEIVSDSRQEDRASWVIPAMAAALPFVVDAVKDWMDKKPPVFEGEVVRPPEPPQPEAGPDLSENPNPDNLEPPA